MHANTDENRDRQRGRNRAIGSDDPQPRSTSHEDRRESERRQTERRKIKEEVTETEERDDEDAPVLWYELPTGHKKSEQQPDELDEALNVCEKLRTEHGHFPNWDSVFPNGIGNNETQLEVVMMLREKTVARVSRLRCVQACTPFAGQRIQRKYQ